MENTNTYGDYWGSNGRYEGVADKLQELVPSRGDVTKENVREGFNFRALERFRRGMNAYYDLYNNGGWNPGRVKGFKGLFGVGITEAKYALDTYMTRKQLHPTLIEVEKGMDKLIILAAVEQGIDIEKNPNFTEGK